MYGSITEQFANNFGYSTLFLIRVKNPQKRTNRRTYRRTKRQTRRVLRPSRTAAFNTATTFQMFSI